MHDGMRHARCGTARAGSVSRPRPSCASCPSPHRGGASPASSRRCAPPPSRPSPVAARAARSSPSPPGTRTRRAPPVKSTRSGSTSPIGRCPRRRRPRCAQRRALPPRAPGLQPRAPRLQHPRAQAAAPRAQVGAPCPRAQVVVLCAQAVAPCAQAAAPRLVPVSTCPGGGRVRPLLSRGHQRGRRLGHLLRASVQGL